MNRPNVLYLVLDAFRADAVPTTETIRTLAEENPCFEEAITPATWSLPAHASLLSGNYPHAHGVTQSGDRPTDLPLVEALNNRGYSTYGVSGNPFFSQNQGFDGPFDRFWYTTLMWFAEGIDASSYRDHLAGLSDLFHDSGVGGLRQFWELVMDLLSHDHRLKSLGNIIYAAGVQLNLKKYGLGRIPHPFVDNSLAYRPEMNTAVIKRIFEREADSDSPFFVFANYMDTHDPYNPPAEFRSDRIKDVGSWKDIRQINDALNEWEIEKDNVDEDLLAVLRELYDGEVRSIDSHVGQLMRSLEEYGLRDDTVVVITADHGENLGETDCRGRRRIGHVSSLSEALVRVPLVIAHPAAKQTTIGEPVSTKDVATAIIEDTLFGAETINASSVLPENGVVLCEAPARGGKDALVENHPDAPQRVIEEETTESNVLGWFDDWKSIRSSSGGAWAWKGAESVKYSSCPEQLRTEIEEAHEMLIKQENEEELSESAINRLENLGYV